MQNLNFWIYAYTAITIFLIFALISVKIVEYTLICLIKKNQKYANKIVLGIEKINNYYKEKI